MNKVATLLLCACFITVLFPQPGYIHPDEFFQSSEIVAGDILNVVHFRAWEFNSTSPIRSIVFPYLLTAPSMYFLRWINSTSFSGFKMSAVKVVMASRLPVAFLNIFGYLASTKLATHFGVDESLSAILWCSSYVFWSYFTRAFSNSVESVLLAMVLLLTLVKPPLLLPRSKEQKGDITEKIAKSKSGKESLERDTDKAGQDTSTMSNPQEKMVPKELSSPLKFRAFLLGMLVTAGFFNRPTFLFFSFIPLVYWVYSLKLSGNLSEKLVLLFKFKLAAILGVLMVFVTFVCIDTLYYRVESREMLPKIFFSFLENPFSVQSLVQNYEALSSLLIITPWNFVKYNSDAGNLVEHGLHPRFTHFLVNLPLLLGPLFIPFVTVCLSTVYLSVKRGTRGPHGHQLWLVLMALVPVAALSIFPHQEPRFLIPLLPVFIVTAVKIVAAMKRGRYVFMITWVMFNIILHLIYGYFHQASVVPVLSIYQQKLASHARQSKLEHHIDHLVFYKTYPPPRHLLLLPDARSDVKIYDLAGSPFKDLMKLVSGLERGMNRPKVTANIYVFLPSTVSTRFVDHLNDRESSIAMNSICPHLSTEAMPRFKEFWKKKITFDEFVTDFCLNIIHISAKLI